MVAPSSIAAPEAATKEDVWIHSSCEMCYSGCGILVHRVNGVVVKIEGDPECPHNLGKQCAKGQASIMTLYDPHRVTTPLKRTNPAKGIGIDPQWEAISWEEALDILCQKLEKVRREDPHKLLLSSWDMAYTKITTPWQRAFGLDEPRMTVTATRCGAGLHSVTFIINGTFNNDVDLDYCNYCILFGSGMGFLTGLNPMAMARKMAEARARGMKLVVIDPRCGVAAAKADEWIPIRPGTDGLMALAMLNVLLNEQEIYDREFIKKHTNGCYLVAPDGTYLRDKETGKPMLWDRAAGAAGTFDAAGEDCALEGNFMIDGRECRPAFQLLKEHIKQYTPEMAAPITTVPAETIRRIAREFGAAAKIGSKIVIDGRELPYRPAAAHYLKGIVPRTQATWQQLSILLLNLAVGSLDSPGSYGGLNMLGPAGSWEPRESPDGLVMQTVKINPTDPYTPKKATPAEGVAPALTRGMDAGSLEFYAFAEPKKYQVQVPPEVALICRTNWLASKENRETTVQGLLNIPFIACFCTMLDETAEFADLVLPDTVSLERHVLFPNSRQLQHIAPVTDYFYWGVVQPVVKPAGEARSWCEVLMEVADRMGFLRELNDEVNRTIADPACRLEPDKKYSLSEVLDKMAHAEFGPEYGLEWFQKHGYKRVKRNVEERYGIGSLKPRVPIYYEHFLRGKRDVEQLMKERGIDWWDTSDFVALPHWKPSPSYTRSQSTEYNLFCIPYTDAITFKTLTPENPWLNEIAERHFRLLKVEINAEAAKKRGIKDGDLVWVESVAGKVKGRARVTECLHPEAVAIAGIFGGWARGKPIARGKGLHHNSLLPADVERVDVLSGAIDDCIEVKVYKAEQ